MSKPDDITTEAWEAAQTIANTVLRNLPDDYGDVTYEIATIARALMEAEERGRTAERERMGALLRNYARVEAERLTRIVCGEPGKIGLDTPAGTQALQDREGT